MDVNVYVKNWNWNSNEHAQHLLDLPTTTHMHLGLPLRCSLTAIDGNDPDTSDAEDIDESDEDDDESAMVGVNRATKSTKKSGATATTKTVKGHDNTATATGQDGPLPARVEVKRKRSSNIESVASTGRGMLADKYAHICLNADCFFSK